VTDTSRRIPIRRIAQAALAIAALVLGVIVAPIAAHAAPTGFVIAQATFSVPANGTAFPDLSCPVGKTAVSGGFERTANLVVAESRPLSSQWHVAAWNPSSTAGTLKVYAVCAAVEVSGRPSSIADVVVEPGSVGSATAVCPAGRRITGGGFLLDDFPQHAGPPANLLQGVTPYWSEPDLSIQGWTVKALNATKTPRLVRAFAICTSMPTSHTVSAVATLAPGESADVNPACPLDQVATGGGWAYGATAARLERSSLPLDDAAAPTVPRSWLGTFVNTNPTATIKARVTAICTAAT
jgi:hypothetical protein